MSILISPLIWAGERLSVKLGIPAATAAAMWVGSKVTVIAGTYFTETALQWKCDELKTMYAKDCKNDRFGPGCKSTELAIDFSCGGSAILTTKLVYECLEWLLVPISGHQSPNNLPLSLTGSSPLSLMDSPPLSLTNHHIDPWTAVGKNQKGVLGLMKNALGNLKGVWHFSFPRPKELA